MRDTPISTLRKHLPELKTKYKVKEIGLSGSIIKGMVKEESDIDVLVEFERGYNILEIDSAQSLNKNHNCIIMYIYIKWRFYEEDPDIS